MSFGSNSCIKNVLCKLNIVSTVGNKVCFALESKHSSEAVYVLNEYTSIRCCTVRTLCSDSQTTLTNKLYSLIDITISLGKGLLAVLHTGTCHGAKLLDVFNCNSHNIIIFKCLI